MLELDLIGHKIALTDADAVVLLAAAVIGSGGFGGTARDVCGMDQRSSASAPERDAGADAAGTDERGR